MLSCGVQQQQQLGVQEGKGLWNGMFLEGAIPRMAMQGVQGGEWFLGKYESGSSHLVVLR